MIEVEIQAHFMIATKPSISISINGKDTVKKVLSQFKGVPSAAKLGQDSFIGLRFSKGADGEEFLTVYGDKTSFGFKCPDKTYSTIYKLQEAEKGIVKETILSKSGNIIKHADSDEWRKFCKENKTPWLLAPKDRAKTKF